MKWQRIRLELAPGAEFPGGSASRAYVIHAPVDEDGRINEAIPHSSRHRARVQRLWPNEPEMSGQLVRGAGGWTIIYRQGQDGDTSLHFDNEVLLVGEHVTFTEPDGQQRRYRVVSVS